MGGDRIEPCGTPLYIALGVNSGCLQQQTKRQGIELEMRVQRGNNQDLSLLLVIDSSYSRLLIGTVYSSEHSEFV